MGVGYCGNRTVYGSWLMDENALSGLEKMVKDVYGYLQEIQKNLQIENNELDNKYRTYIFRDSEEPIIEVVSFDRVVVVANTFKELFESLELRGKVPQKVSICLRCLGMRVELTLSSGNFSSNFFKYEVIGNENIANYEKYKNIVIGKIENWIDENKPDLFLVIWYNIAKWASVCICIFLSVMFLAVAIYAGNKEQYYKIYESEIEEILEQGITEENRDRAMELILLKQYEFVPKEWIEENSQKGDNILLAGLCGILLCVFVRICPRANFSIGKGKKRVKFWHCYRKVMFVVLPTVIIIPILINLFV